MQESDESDGESTPFPTFDYGEYHSQPDALLSTLVGSLSVVVMAAGASSRGSAVVPIGVLSFRCSSAFIQQETQSNNWSSPTRHATGSSVSASTKERGASSSSLAVAEERGDFQASGSSRSLASIPPALSCGKGVGVLTVGRLLPWLVHFLSQIRREANRRRIANVSCSQPHCRFSYMGSYHLSLGDLGLMKCVWVEMFCWLCTHPSQWDRLALLEQSAPNRWSQSSHAQQQATTKEYRYSLLNIIRGKGGYMPSHFRMSRRLVRIETRRRELLAIIPYGSDQEYGIIKQTTEGDKTLSSQQLWETALIVGFCAWKHHESSSKHQKYDNSNSLGRSETHALPEDMMVLNPPALDQKKENQIQPTTQVLNQETVHEKTELPIRTRKKYKDTLDSSEVPSKRLRRPSTVNDLNRVLLEEKSRRNKARAKEISMLQRFGLCSGQDPNEDLFESDTEMDDSNIDESSMMKMSDSKLLRLSQSDLPGPPLRCGSPSSLDRRLKRKFPSIPITNGEELLEEQQLINKRSKHNTKPEMGVDQEPIVLLAGTYVPQKSVLTNPGEEGGANSTICRSDDESGEAAIPSHSTPTSPLLPSMLDYDDTSSAHSAPPPLSADMESQVSPGQKPDPLASRVSPLTYDDDIELSESAKSMLQALENRHFQQRNADHPDNGVDQADQTEHLETTSKLSRRERKQQRKEAKEKRREAKKKRKKVKRSKKKLDAPFTSVPRSPPTASQKEIDEGRYSKSGANFVAKPNEIRTVCKPDAKYSKTIDLVSSQADPHLDTTAHEDKLHFDQCITSATDSSKRQQHEPAPPSPAAMIGPPLLTPPAHSRIQAPAHVEERTQQQELSAVRLLCSESFVENWGELVAKLATGSWNAPFGGSRICFLDTSLVDFVGVDIEKQGQGAVIVCLLSATMRSGFSRLLKRVIDIASLSRYTTLEVIICADVETESSLNGIARLQNAVMRHKGVPKTLVSVRLVSSRSLASCLANSLLPEGSSSASSVDFDFIEHHIVNKKTWERLRFLLAIVPSLGVCKAFELFQFLGDGDRSDAWLQRLFDGANIQQSGMIGDDISRQLRMQLSFALSTPLGR